MIGKKAQKAILVAQSLLIILLTFLIAGMIYQINNLRGTARVINYAGLVRGATQRAVKLEIVDQGDDEVIEFLDEVTQGLRYKSAKYDLVQLKDDEYLSELDAQITVWGELKKEIQKVRQVGYRQTRIVELSELYFQMADATVSAAERYSEAIASRIRYLEIGSVADIVLLILIMLEQTAQEVIIRRKNRLLEQKVFIDEHTGLPNKGRCEQFFTDYQHIQDSMACIVFDLNNLKKANDTLGHSVGDQLIENFARLLRGAIPAPNFVGRYGGDEFMAVIYDASEETVKKLLEGLQADVSEFNRLHHGNGFIAVSFAYGYALSGPLPGCSFRVLFDQADRHMYENKQQSKDHRTE